MINSWDARNVFYSWSLFKINELKLINKFIGVINVVAFNFSSQVKSHALFITHWIFYTVNYLHK